MRALLVLIAGIVLLNNAAWFAGAHTVGVILTLLGGGWLVLGAIFILLAIVGASG